MRGRPHSRPVEATSSSFPKICRVRYAFARMSTVHQDGDFEQALAAIDDLAKWYSTSTAERNEATTRLLLIDRLFFDCLGWHKEDVEVEAVLGGEYADYVFSAPRQLLIVEAKREGTYFEIPAGERRIELSLAPLLRSNAPLKAAVHQVAEYCHTRGVPLGCVTNGHQLVAFIATRNDGVPLLEGRALVFPSLDAMAGSFLELWQALSKPGVAAKNVARRLLGESVAKLPPKLADAITPYPGLKRRPPLQIDLQLLSELIIEDVVRSRDLEPAFLRESCCHSGALSQYAMTTKAILGARYANVLDSSPGVTTPASTRDGISPEIVAIGF